MKSPLCERVQRFAGGELGPEEAEAFRAHAATCETCRRELADLAQLHVLEDRHRDRFRALAGRIPASPAPISIFRRPLAVAGGITALAAGVLLVLWLVDRDRQRTLLDAFGDGRTSLARSAYPVAGDYRPVRQSTLGSSPGEVTRVEKALSMMERKGDSFGIAAVRLARGKQQDAEEALLRLQPLPDDPEILSERAYAYLVRGNSEQRDIDEALRLANRALEAKQDLAPALWNRAVAKLKLGLKLAAARDFEAIAARGERGWADEARDRARTLREEMENEEKAWVKARDAGRALVERGALPEDDALKAAPILRYYLYEAVRVRDSREAVLGLLEPARALDRLAGDHALEQFVTGIAAHDFAVRGPLARDYRRLYDGDRALDSGALFDRLRASREADILLGAFAWLIQGKSSRVEVPLEELHRLSQATEGEPWLNTQAAIYEAAALQRAGNDVEQKALLEKALDRCTQAKLVYRCLELQIALAYSHDRGTELEQGLDLARRGWKTAADVHEWGRQVQFILFLAEMTRLREDTDLARAYYEEALERGRKGELLRYASEGLALLDVHRLRFAEARRELKAAVETGLPLGLTGALALSDLARVDPAHPDEDARAMQAFRGRPSGQVFGKGEQALAAEAFGRWLLGRDRAEGLRVLGESMAMARKDDLALRDPYARRALTYGFTALIFDAGKRGDAAEALRLFEEEWAGAGGALPSKCMLAVTVDGERTLAIARGAEGGAPVAFYDDRRTAPLLRELSGLLPAQARAFPGCATVAVLARAPVYGRPGLLPPDIAWSYLGGRPARQEAAPAGPRRSLVVQGTNFVTPPWERERLGALDRWGVSEPGTVELADQAATPSAVLQRMKSATDITFVTHAVVNPDSDEAVLLLSPEPGGGKSTLTATDLLKEPDLLQQRPVVFLASCRGAPPAPVLHEARSLPAAFLRAGARAVLAASDDVPQLDGPTFFAGVSRRMQAGAAPAEALRAERADWKARGGGHAWLDGVLLFE